MEVTSQKGPKGNGLPFFDLDRWAAHDVFQFLRPDQIAVLSDASSTFACCAGDNVYRQGMKVGHIYVVLKGKVALRHFNPDGIGVLISEVNQGDMFGSCLSLDLGFYSLTAQCVEDSHILKINADILRRVMDADPRTGYAIQSRISTIYFKRYIATMQKFRNVITTLPADYSR